MDEESQRGGRGEGRKWDEESQRGGRGGENGNGMKRAIGEKEEERKELG